MKPKAATLQAANNKETSNEDDLLEDLGPANLKTMPKVFYADVHLTPHQAIGIATLARMCNRASG